MIGGFNDTMARNDRFGNAGHAIPLGSGIPGFGPRGPYEPPLKATPDPSGPNWPGTGGAPSTPGFPGLTAEQELLNKGPKAVWDDWLQRMGGFLAATPRETPNFGDWNYHFTAPGSAKPNPWGDGGGEGNRSAAGRGFPGAGRSFSRIMLE